MQLRLAAARVLGRLNDPDVSRRLVQLVFASQAAREALVALSESREPYAARFISDAQQDLALTASVREARRRAVSAAN